MSFLAKFVARTILLRNQFSVSRYVGDNYFTFQSFNARNLLSTDVRYNYPVFTDKTANTQDGARLDIAANGLWGGRFERTYVDVRIFNPHAPSNRHPSLAACYKKHENIKKRAYQRRVCEVEHAPSHHLSCLPPEVWLERPLYSTNDLLLALPPSGISLTHQHSIGCVAV